MRRRYGYYWTKLIGAVVVLAASLAAFVLIGDTWWQLFTAAGLAILFTQIAMLGHDAAHRQIFVSGRWNDWTSMVLGNLLVGMSYGWWQHKHTRHHANPNKIGSDPDIELPVVSFTPDQVEQRAKQYGPALAWVMAHQGMFFFPILLLEGLVAPRLERAPRRRARAAAPAQRRDRLPRRCASAAISPWCSSCSRPASRPSSWRCSSACSASTWAWPSPRTTRGCRSCRPR